MNVNKVFAGGNLTRDPELRFTPTQTAVLDLNIATNRKWKTDSGETKEEVTFIGCTAFGRTAEVIAQYFRKGNRIFIEGRLKQETWEKDGQKNTKTKVIIESLQFVEKSNGNQQPQSAPPVATKPRQTTANTPAAQPDLPSDSDDDVPF